jgi:hypothetical protein
MIKKYTLEFTDTQIITIPDGDLLHLGEQNGKLCMWVAEEQDAKYVNFTIFLVGTGHDVPEEATEHLGTVIMKNLVWHVFAGEVSFA